MRGSRVALRFAKSLFDLAIEQNKLDAVYADMQLVESTCANSHDLVVLFGSPVVATDTKKKIVDEVFKANVNELSLAFLQIIVVKRRESYIPAIAAEFVEMYKANKGIETATLTTAVKVDDETRNKIISLVQAKTGKKVELVEVVNADLIGGFVLRYGDNQVDTSIAAKVRELNKEFEKNLYIKDY